MPVCKVNDYLDISLVCNRLSDYAVIITIFGNDSSITVSEP